MPKATKKSTFYIYCYENRLNGKVYIGQTVNLKRRDIDHSIGYNLKSSALEQAIQKYGRDTFDYWTICIVDTIKKANQEEIFWIAEMRKQLGRASVYNLTDGGGGTTGRFCSKETRGKMSKIHKGKTISEQHRISVSGENSVNAKLNNDQVRQIRELKAQDQLSNKKLGTIFNVSSGTIRDIITNKTWKKI